MPSNNPPLEILCAFAIVFVSGALLVIGFAKWSEKIRRDASGANPSN